MNTMILKNLNFVTKGTHITINVKVNIVKRSFNNLLGYFPLNKADRNIVKNHCLVNLNQFILFSHNVSTKLSPYSVEYLIIKRFSGSGSGKKIAKEVAKAASPKVSPPSYTGSTTQLTSKTPSDVNSHDGLKNPQNSENIENPQDLKGKFINPQDVKFLQDIVKDNAVSNVHQDTEDLALEENVAQTPISETLISVYTENKFVIINNSGQQQPLTEEKHNMTALEKENGALEIFGILTSSQGNTSTSQNNNIKLSSTKFNGTYTPITNKKSNMDDYGYSMSKDYPTKPIVDNDGYTVPSPNKGGQFFRKTSAIIVSPGEREKLNIQEDINATKYLSENSDININMLEVLNHSKQKNEYSLMFSEETINELNIKEEKNTNLNQNETLDHTDVIIEYVDEVD